MHPNGDVIATGEIGEMPAIIIWDVRKMKQIQTMSSILKGAVSLLGFSPDGKRLACIGND